MTSDQEPCPNPDCGSRRSFEGFCSDCGGSLSKGVQSTLPSTADRPLQRPVPEPPVPKATVREPNRPNPIPNDGISFDVPRYRARDSERRLAALIHDWFEFVFSSAEAEQELRRLQQSGFTKGEALATICTRSYEGSFCPAVATRAHNLRCEHLFQGREREQFERGAISFMSHTYTLDIGNEVGALLKKREDE